MTRAWPLACALVWVCACSGPEPGPAAAGPAAGPAADSGAEVPVDRAAEAAPGYVDPLEAARAEAQAQGPGDASWREGYDRRSEDGSEPEGSPVADRGLDDPGAAPPAGAALPAPSEANAIAPGSSPAGGPSPAPAGPPSAPPPTNQGPVPLIDPGLSPRDPDATARRPPDAQPPPRE